MSVSPSPPLAKLRFPEINWFFINFPFFLKPDVWHVVLVDDSAGVQVGELVQQKKAFLGIFAIDRERLKRKWSDDQSIALTFRQREVIVSWTLVLALDNTTLSPNTAWW